MKNPYILVPLLGLILVGAACKKPNTQQTATNTNQAQANTNLTNAPGTNGSDSSNSNVGSGQYVNYSDTVIASTSGRKILFFHAAWCPQCRQLEKSITSGRIPDNVTIIKVDYDSMQSLRQKYGVTLQTTVILVDDRGEPIKKFVAYDDPSLDRVVRELL